MTSNNENSFWNTIVEAPRDAILGLNQSFMEDQSPNKLNLGVGAYRDDDGKPFVLRVVREIEKEIANSTLNKEYLPQDGLAEFREETIKLVLGADHPAIKEKRVAVCQGISGTGSLRIGFEFFKAFFPNTIVYVSNPTWGNHQTMLKSCSLTCREYRYLNEKTSLLDFEGMMEDISKAPERSVILLHMCAHNPTGVDPNPEQWGKIADLMEQRNLIPFFDSAYQGFASGNLAKDAFAGRMFASRGMEIIVAQSYAKNFGLYGERIGAISFVCKDTKTANNVQSQLKAVVRPLYSNPPLHGARIVAMTLKNPKHFQLWEEDLKIMANRINEMRHALYNALQQRQTPGEWSHIIKQIGMFSYTGLTPNQVKVMVEKFHIHMLSNGRISMAGLNSKVIPYMGDAMDYVVRNVK